MKAFSIQEQLGLLPDNPGVYLFKDKAGEMLYIGKAISLRKRVPSYFGKEGPKDRPNLFSMVEKVTTFDIIVTDTEVEALILEASLIKKHRPYYNMRLKDDKHFPYVKVTLSDAFPRFAIVRRVEKDGSRYFGPFTDARLIRRTVNFLRQTFMIRQCRKRLPLSKKERPCLYFHTKRCYGPCDGGSDEKEYRHRIEQACSALAGNYSHLLKDLNRAMNGEAENENYEKAAILRDRIKSIENIIKKQKMDEADSAVSRDVLSIARRAKTGCMVVLRIREGLLIEKQHFPLCLAGFESAEEALSSFISQYYLHQRSIPREVVMPVMPTGESMLTAWLSQKRGSNVRLIKPQKGEKVRILEMAQRNAEILLVEEFARQQDLSGSIHPAVSALQRELGLQSLPRRMECFDVSHLHGKDTVASMIVFVDAKPSKKRYRHYKIASVKGIDDFASMKEVVDRRVRRLKEENETLPDLFLVDGGKGQLSAAVDALAENGFTNIPIAALAKRIDEIFLPGHGSAIMLQKNSPALRLLQRIRDEAHRFAISFHRKLRSKATTQSELDKVSGIGPERKKKLLQVFGSVAGVKSADEEKIASIVGKSAARKVMQYFAINK